MTMLMGIKMGITVITVKMAMVKTGMVKMVMARMEMVRMVTGMVEKEVKKGMEKKMMARVVTRTSTQCLMEFKTQVPKIKIQQQR